MGWTTHEAMRRLYENFEKSTEDNSESIPVLESKGADGQETIASVPDGYWIPKQGRKRQAAHYVGWASHLLVTSGQRNNTARLTASASDNRYLGIGWSPVVGPSIDEAKAVSVFINSTPGRLQLMRGPGQTIEFPTYKPRTIEGLKVPDIKDDLIRGILAGCWERTKDMEVPQFRDGECEVRRLWDEAVADAMGWDAEELTTAAPACCIRNRMCAGWATGNSPTKSTLSRPIHERFNKLADQWEIRNCAAVTHPDLHRLNIPAHQKIISMGEPAVPLILQRMQITGRTLVLRAARNHRRQSRETGRQGQGRNNAGILAGVGRSQMDTPSWARLLMQEHSPRLSERGRLKLLSSTPRNPVQLHRIRCR